MGEVVKIKPGENGGKPAANQADESGLRRSISPLTAVIAGVVVLLLVVGGLFLAFGGNGIPGIGVVGNAPVNLSPSKYVPDSTPTLPAADDMMPSNAGGATTATTGELSTGSGSGTPSSPPPSTAGELPSSGGGGSGSSTAGELPSNPGQ